MTKHQQSRTRRIRQNPRLSQAARQSIHTIRQRKEKQTAAQWRVKRYFHRFSGSVPYALYNLDKIRAKLNDEREPASYRVSYRYEVESLEALIAYNAALKAAIDAIKRGDDPRPYIPELVRTIQACERTANARQQYRDIQYKEFSDKINENI